MIRTCCLLLLLIALSLPLQPDIVRAETSAPEQGSDVPAQPAIAASAPAVTDKTPALPYWNAEAELGMIITSGNTETESINAKFKVENDRVRWRHRLNAEYLKTSNALAVTAEQYSGSVKSDLKVSERDYFYVTARYIDDVFAGYRYQVSEATGYGRRFPLMTGMVLELEIGAGGRHTKFVDETREGDSFGRGALKYSWKLDKQGELAEEAFTEVGRNNTHTESVSSLKARLNSMLAMKLSYSMKHDSRVKSSAGKTDRVLAATMVFDLI